MSKKSLQWTSFELINFFQPQADQHGVNLLQVTGKQMRRLLLVALLAISSAAGAVVIRSDVEDAEYRVPASTSPALVDMPGEGHGVLIAPQWVVTAAHAAPMQMQGMEDEVSIGGIARGVKRVIPYPGYKKLPNQLINEALASGDLSKVSEFLASSNDIALIELASPVTDVTPVPLYRGNKEVGKIVELVGKGATGNGTKGQDPYSSHRADLRRAINGIVGADSRYVWYRFDPPSSALPLEGITGSGDSGGPLLLVDGGSSQLVGLASWTSYPPGHPFWSEWAPGRPFVEGLYGVIVYAVRISSYIQWIEGVISAPTNARTQPQPGECCSSNHSSGDGMTPVTAKINEAILPIARGEKYGQPLDTFLAGMGIGQVTGGGTSLGPSGEPNWVDIGFDLKDPDTNATLVARKLKELGAPVGSYLHYWIGAQKHEILVE